MNKFTDRGYLREQQYKTPANLEARITLHRKFGTTQENWFHWVISHAALDKETSILELGCGPGDLWRECATFIPETISITLGDLSAGMLRQARNAISKLANPRFLVIDAQFLPLHRSSFDLVIANHMLYHVPDIQQALREIRRVLRPGGRFLAATNGNNHMRQLDDLIRKHSPQFAGMRNVAQRFSLENAAEILSPVFPDNQVYIFENDLKVTETLPLANYIESLGIAIEGLIDQNILEAIIADAHIDIDKFGYFYIGKSQGLILAT